MKLKELCVLDVACCHKGTTIAEAARRMREHHTGDLVVTDESDGTREPVGILTDRDIVMEVVAKGRDPDRTPVREVMASPLVVVSGSESVATATHARPRRASATPRGRPRRRPRHHHSG